MRKHSTKRCIKLFVSKVCRTNLSRVYAFSAEAPQQRSVVDAPRCKSRGQKVFTENTISDTTHTSIYTLFQTYTRIYETVSKAANGDMCKNGAQKPYQTISRLRPSFNPFHASYLTRFMSACFLASALLSRLQSST